MAFAVNKTCGIVIHVEYHPTDVSSRHDLIIDIEYLCRDSWSHFEASGRVTLCSFLFTHTLYILVG
jgi:hypothetical protein